MSLTRQLLLFSRKEAPTPERLELNAVVGDVERMLARVLGKGVSIVSKLAPDLDAIEADHSQLDQVLVNLAVNARDAMPAGGELTVTTRNVCLDEAAAREVGVPEGAYVELSVRDTGCGMDRATLARIFEPFFTTKEAGKGTGLGLATVFGIVQQHRGGIAVDSEPGRGTTFRVCLPRAARETPATKRAEAAPQASRLSSSPPPRPQFT